MPPSRGVARREERPIGAGRRWHDVPTRTRQRPGPWNGVFGRSNRFRVRLPADTGCSPGNSRVPHVGLRAGAAQRYACCFQQSDYGFDSRWLH